MNTNLQSKTRENIQMPVRKERPADDITEEGAVRLACAILEEAYRDYVAAIKVVKKFVDMPNKNAKQHMQLLNALKAKTELEIFYNSRWFHVLTMGACQMTPNEVMNKICEVEGLN